MKRQRFHPVDIHVGQKLRGLRLANNFTQKRLADALEITFQHVQNYEKGASKLPASALYRAASILGTSVDAFFDGIDANLDRGDASQAQMRPVGDPDGVVAFIHTPEGVRLNRAFRLISNPQRRQAMLALLESIAASQADESEA